MDKAEKRVIRIKINDILERECDPCPNKQSKGNTPYQCLACPVHIKLNDLGNMLTNEKSKPGKRRKCVRVKHEDFVKLFKEGKTDKEIIAITNASYQTVEAHRNKMINGTGPARSTAKYEQYAQYFEQGLNCKEVMKITGCTQNTYYSQKRKWRESHILKGLAE